MLVKVAKKRAMDVKDFPLLPIHNLKDDDTIRLEFGASGASASENTLNQIM